jgi:IS5 family transposase
MGHVVIENRNGLVVQSTLTHATGTAEREAACAMIDELADAGRITLAADKAYDTTDFVAEMRKRGVTPHVAQNNKGRRSAIDGRTTRHPGYAISQVFRKRIEEVFGWTKAAAGLRKTRHRGTARVGWMFTLNAAAYNLIRLPKLLGDSA